MGWSGGTFSRVRNWQNDQANSINIDSDKHDEEDDNLAAGINQSVNKDGSNAFTGNANLGTKRVASMGKGTARDDAVRVDQIQDTELQYAADTGSANAYVISLSPTPVAYAAGQVVRVKIANSNTGASTLNVNSIGTKAIQKHGAALTGGELKQNLVVPLVYDGTQFQMLSAADFDPSTAGTYVADTGSANAYAVAPAPALAA